MAEKKFNFFESYHRALRRVPDESYGRVVRGMALFVFEGVEPHFTNDIDIVAWELIKPILQRGQELSKVRAEVGRMGGKKGKGVPKNLGNNFAQKQNKSKSIAKEKQNNSGIGKGKEIGIGIDYEEKNKKENETYLPEYVLPGFADVMSEWLAYKQERGEAYKPKGLKACYTKLYNLSRGNPETARAIIEQSMSSNYSGLFNLKQDNNYGETNRQNYRGTAADNIFAAQAAHMRQLAASIGQTADRKGEVLAKLPFD